MSSVTSCVGGGLFIIIQVYLLYLLACALQYRYLNYCILGCAGGAACTVLCAQLYLALHDRCCILYTAVQLLQCSAPAGGLVPA
jgi:hypothetical protein